MLNSAVIVVVARESMEAMLILAILTAIVFQQRQPRLLAWLSAGAAGGVGLSAFATYAVYSMPDLISDSVLNFFDILAPLLSATFILQLLWTLRKSTRNPGAALRDRVSGHLERGEPWGLALISLFVVWREGFEIVLFLQGELMEAHAKGGVAPLLTSFGAGLLLAASVFLLVQTGLRRVGLSWFFRVTTVLLAFTAGYFLVEAYHRATLQGIL